MLNLLVDAVTAVVILTDRVFTAVENALDLRPSPRAVDGGAQPAGADASATAGTGGHPRVWSTSELLGQAAGQLIWVYEDRTPAVVQELVDDLVDRAAQFKAAGD